MAGRLADLASRYTLPILITCTAADHPFIDEASRIRAQGGGCVRDGGAGKHHRSLTDIGQTFG